MKNQFTVNTCIIFILFSCLTGCQKNIMDRLVTQPAPVNDINPNYSKADALNKLIHDYTRQGIPGASIAVFDTTQGWWESTAGFAKIEDQTPLLPGHLHYLQSIAKTYTAVAVLQLYEHGQISLDALMTDYLPSNYSALVTNADKITVRMLLNHTSGIHDFSSDAAYTARLIQNPLEKLTTMQILSYIKGKSAVFAPGSKYEYSNTNYELLALIVDHITGNHAQYIVDHILKPLDLTQTFYRGMPGYLNYPNLVNSYIDRFSNGSIENVSAWQITNVSNMIGDDGIVATPRDAVKFLRAIFEGKLLKQSSVDEMITFAEADRNKETYHAGLFHVYFGSTEAFGHGGAGIGSGCGLYYLPSKKIYVFMAVNLGTIVEGPLVDKINELKDKIITTLGN